MIRCFDSDDIQNVNPTVDPIRDLEIIETEMMLADLESIQKRLEKNNKKNVEEEQLKILEIALDCINNDKDISIFWTGNEVVSKEINCDDLKELSEIFRNEILIWDNFFANDYCPGRIYLGELTGRKFEQEKIEAIGVNPTGLPNVDSLILNRLAGEKTEDILKKFSIPEAFNKLLPFFDSPFSKLESEINSKGLREIQHEVCIEWKSPLQVEIAPFLWEFYNHLTLLEKYSKEEK